MKYLLIPSRHIMYSKEQYEALQAYLAANTYDCVIFAITSYNLNNCKYSPVNIYHRISLVNSLIYALQEKNTFTYRIHIVPHFNHMSEYTSAIIKYTNYDLQLDLSQNNTDVFAFGKYLGEEFRSVGYTTYSIDSVDHVQLFKELFVNNNQAYFDQHIAPCSKRVIDNQTEILVQAKKIWLDTILQEKGSITDTRNYQVYTESMSNTAMIELKYNDIKEYVVEGKIVDEGCADAALFIPIAKQFPDSDLIGVDISNDFIARANERIREGYFGNSFVTILQANLLNTIFEDNSINTVICNSTMHEIWSYNNKKESLASYLKLKHQQLVPGGRLLIRDVVGPEDPTAIVYMRSVHDDNALFKTFMQDFKHVRVEDVFEECEIDGAMYIQANYKIISEYLLHKDYRENWKSEMNEEFCHLNVQAWKDLLKEHGFNCITSKAYRSEWIVKNRFENQILLLNEKYEKIEYPYTNIVVVGEKQ